jgi:hypothetical protein
MSFNPQHQAENLATGDLVLQAGGNRAYEWMFE